MHLHMHFYHKKPACMSEPCDVVDAVAYIPLRLQKTLMRLLPNGASEGANWFTSISSASSWP